MEFFNVKIQSGKLQSNGATTAKAYNYVIQCESVTESEAVAISQLESDNDPFFRVVSSKPYPISEIIGLDNASDFFYRVGVSMCIFCEKTGKEKRVVVPSLVCADSLDEVLPIIHKAYTDSVVDYDIKSITTENIEEVILIGQGGGKDEC